MPCRNRRQDAERELGLVLDQEGFGRGTDITRGLVDAANYMARNAPHKMTSCLQPPFRAARRLKAGDSQDWLPHDSNR